MRTYPMKNLLQNALLILSVTLVGACTSFKTSNDYMSVPEDSIARPDPGRALLVFERDNARVGEWSSLGVWEITGRDPQLIGLLHGTMKAAWSVDPGDHDFMLNIGGEAQMLKAHVDAGKTYFVQLNHNMWDSEGPSSYRFCPVRAGTENPMSNTNIGRFNTSAKAEAEGRLESAAKHIEKVYRVWDEYSDELKQRFTMHADDGR